MRLADKVALVTGGGSDRGIGRAIALAFAREGAAVAIVDIDGDSAREAARQLREAGARALALQVDVAERARVREAVETTEAGLGPMDILVNNAGFCVFKPFLEIDDSLWDRTLAVNLKGYFICGQEVARRMIRNGRGGKIINISSISAESSSEEKVHYSVTKAGIKSLTQGMALELARYQINVNAIAPGLTDTRILKEARIQRLLEQERCHSSVPWGRIGQPEDITGAALFLASSESDYVTGATIVVDGGLSAGDLLPRLEE